MRRGCRKVTRAFRSKPSHNRRATSVTAPKKRPHSSARYKAKPGHRAREKSLMASEMAVRAEAGLPEEGRKSSSRPVDLGHLSPSPPGERKPEAEPTAWLAGSAPSSC